MRVCSTVLPLTISSSERKSRRLTYLDKRDRKNSNCKSRTFWYISASLVLEKLKFYKTMIDRKKILRHLTPIEFRMKRNFKNFCNFVHRKDFQNKIIYITIKHRFTKIRSNHHGGVPRSRMHG